MKTYLNPVVAACALALAGGPAYAVDYYLAAKAYSKTMPDGSVIPMWGYVLDVSGTCYNAADDAARLACVGTLANPTSPGPQLKVAAANGTPQTALRIFLSNGLPEPTSIVVTGQELPFSNASNGPTWNDGTLGPRTSPAQKVRSYGREAAANGGRMQYIWNDTRTNAIANSGSFIYRSGTLPQKQTYMGLYGAVTKDVTGAQGQVYPGVSYSNEVVLFYSDIDPVINMAIAKLYDPNNPAYSAVEAYTSSIDYKARWFLVNGQPFGPGVADIPAGNPGSSTLVRFLSTASETHVPTLQGLYANLHGEDGRQYTYQDGTGSHASPRQQYSIELPPLKTKDAIVSSATATRHAVYDGNGYMTNPSDPTNPATQDTLGGMLRFLSFGGTGSGIPVANNDVATTLEGTAVSINVLANDSDPDNAPSPLTITNPTQGINGSVACTTTCTYTPTTVGFTGTDSFTYTVSDGTNTSAAATVTVTVNLNQPPLAVADQAALNQGSSTVIDVLANDSDPEGQTPAITSASPTAANGTVACTATNCTYTPNAAFFGNDSFSYTVSDGVKTANATVSVTVNGWPVANDDTATTNQDVAVTVHVLSNAPADSDPEGQALAITAWTQGSNGSVVCDSANGLCIYTPNAGFFGNDAFTYTISDGAASDTATVNVTVTQTTGGASPIRLYFSTLGNGSVPGVAGPFDDADLYTLNDLNVFARLKDATATIATGGLGLAGSANIDALSIIDDNHFYLSFAAASTTLPVIGAVQDEDVVEYNNGVWSLYFDGTVCGLNDGAGNGDIDAIHVSGSTLYFSTVGNQSVSGLGAADDADIYAWTQGAASCSRVFDGSANGLANAADVDGLSVVDGNTFYLSFEQTSTTVPVLGTVQDEDVVLYDAGTWSVFRDGTALGLGTANEQDVDAIHVVTP